MTTQNTPVWSSRTFETLDQCLTFVQQKHQQKSIQGLVKDMATGEESEGPIPSYLFRGEVGWFCECLSRMERVRRGHFCGVTEAELKPIEKDTDNYFKKQLAKYKIDIFPKGLMQHYGFPTDLIDASDSIHTAAFFRSPRSRRCRQGCVCSIRYEEACSEAAQFLIFVGIRWQFGQGVKKHMRSIIANIQI